MIKVLSTVFILQTAAADEDKDLGFLFKHSVRLAPTIHSICILVLAI